MGVIPYKFKRDPRIGMSIDILVLMLLSTSFFELAPLQGFFAGNNAFTFLVIYMAYMYIRYMGLTFRQGIMKHLIPLVWIFVSLLVSFIPAYLYYGQHLYHSLVVYRKSLVFLSLPLLLSIRPTLREMHLAFYAFGVLFTIVSFLATYVYQDWLIPAEGMEYVLQEDPLKSMSGLIFMPTSLVFALDDYRRSRRRKYLYLSIFLYAVVFLVQNRTMILSSSAVVFAAAFFNTKARSRLVSSVYLIFFILMVLLVGWDYLSALMDETMGQLTDEDYNRVKAFNYFISPVNGELAFVWGNGFISGHVSSLMADLREEGIYNSDLGLIGLWNQFGLLFPLSVLYYQIQRLSHKSSFHVRAMALSMLLCALTMAYYFTYASILWLCFFYFLMGTDVEYYRNRDIERRRTLKRMKRYRSLYTKR